MSPFLLLFASAIVLFGQLVTRIEKWNKFDGLYWSFITATTVGYGDIRPTKKISKSLSILISLLGLMFTGLIIAITLNSATAAFEKHIDPTVIEKVKDNIVR
jgi:voltage-gated potassium channel